MEEYTNKWNINMNTLGLADYNVKEKAKIYGYAAKKDEFVESYLYEEESECVIAWYNAHCQSVDQISEICEIVLDQDDKKAALENCQAHLKKQPLRRIPLQAADYSSQSEYMRYSMICNGVLQGSIEDIVTEEDMKKYGYGLLYWENDNVCTFFDNRMAVMFRKLRELKQQGIYPICIRLPKKNNQPIPVAEGRKQIKEFVWQENLKEQYDELQKLCQYDDR